MTLKQKTAIAIVFIFITLLCVSLSVHTLYSLNQYFSPEPIISGVFNSQPVWDFETTESITSTPELDDNGHVFIRTSESVIALDAQNGNLLWAATTPSDSPLSIAPHVFDDYLVVPEKGSRVAVFSISTGELIWRIPAVGTSLDNPRIKSIAFSNDLLYIARYDWAVTAYRIDDGEIIWEQKYSTRYSPSITVDHRAMYLGLESEIKAFDTLTGALLWEEDLDASIRQITLDGDILFISDNSKRGLIAFDLKKREILWRTQYEKMEDSILRCFLINNDVIYIAARELIAVSKSNGQIIWKSDRIGDLECPVVIDNSLYVRNTETLLFAFDLKSGQEIGRMTVQFNTPMLHEPDRGPAGMDGMLFVPINSQHIVAYSP